MFRVKFNLLPQTFDATLDLVSSSASRATMPDLLPQLVEGNGAASVASQVGEQVKFERG